MKRFDEKTQTENRFYEALVNLSNNYKYDNLRLIHYFYLPLEMDSGEPTLENLLVD